MGVVGKYKLQESNMIYHYNAGKLNIIKDRKLSALDEFSKATHQLEKITIIT
jgi:hypothetical protein